jgi:TPR repeat protein
MSDFNPQFRPTYDGWTQVRPGFWQDLNGRAERRQKMNDARAQYEDKANQGDAEAQYELGRVLSENPCEYDDMLQGANYLKESAKQGNPKALSLLGMD